MAGGRPSVTCGRPGPVLGPLPAPVSGPAGGLSLVVGAGRGSVRGVPPAFAVPSPRMERSPGKRRAQGRTRRPLPTPAARGGGAARGVDPALCRAPRRRGRWRIMRPRAAPLCRAAARLPGAGVGGAGRRRAPVGGAGARPAHSFGPLWRCPKTEGGHRTGVSGAVRARGGPRSDPLVARAGPARANTASGLWASPRDRAPRVNGPVGDGNAGEG